MKSSILQLPKTKFEVNGSSLTKRHSSKKKERRITTLFKHKSKSNSDFRLSKESSILAPRYTEQVPTTI